MHRGEWMRRTARLGVPPGIADSLAGQPLFSLVPSATVDEGNNWINVSWGPLSMSNTSLTGGTYGNYGGGLPLRDYVAAAGSSGGFPNSWPRQARPRRAPRFCPWGSAPAPG